MTAWPTHPTGHNKTIAEMTASEREAMCNASKARTRPNLSTVLRDLEGDAGLANEGKRA